MQTQSLDTIAGSIIEPTGSRTDGSHSSER